MVCVFLRTRKPFAFAAACLAMTILCGCQPAKNAEPRKTKNPGAAAKAVVRTVMTFLASLARTVCTALPA